ncbi:MAG: hypothetical protein JNM10_13700 [Planctomycetia bacterium]|nr:hypothetical protein [Planctomycetia bacterium]
MMIAGTQQSVPGARVQVGIGDSASAYWTDRAGTASIPADAIHVRVWAMGFDETEVDTRKGGSPVVVHLQPLNGVQRIRGLVADSRRSGLQGALVCSSDGYRAVCDETGLFVLSRPRGEGGSSEDLTLFAWAPDHAVRAVPIRDVDTDELLLLLEPASEPTCRCTIRAETPGGRPAALAEFHWFAEDARTSASLRSSSADEVLSFWTNWHGTPLDRGYTDQNGRLTLPPLPFGTYRVQLRSSPVAASDALDLSAPSVEKTIVLRRGRRVLGTTAATPIDGAIVELRVRGKGERVWMSTSTSVAGSAAFAIDGLIWDEDLLLEVTLPGGLSMRPISIPASRDDEVNVGSIQIPALRTVRGTVRFRDGRTVGSATIRVRQESVTPPRVEIVRGTFVIPGVGPNPTGVEIVVAGTGGGTYFLSARDADLVAESWDLVLTPPELPDDGPR